MSRFGPCQVCGNNLVSNDHVVWCLKGCLPVREIINHRQLRRGQGRPQDIPEVGWYDDDYLRRVGLKRLRRPDLSTAWDMIARQRKLAAELGMDIPQRVEIFAPAPARLEETRV